MARRHRHALTPTGRAPWGRAFRYALLAVVALLLAMPAAAERIADPDLLRLVRTAPTAKDYPDDDAVVLLREVEMTVEASGAVSVRERKLVTLLTERGLALAQWELPYDKSCETLEVRTARTLQGDQAFPVVAGQTTDSALYPGLAWYDSLVVRRFPLPGAVVGSTLEVETVQTRAAARMPGEFSTRLHLQGAQPVREARFTLRMPPAMPPAIRFAGPLQPDVQTREEAGYRVYAWTVHDVPALHITEPQTPAAADLLASARIATLPSWAPVAAWYRQITADKDAVTPLVRQVAEERTAGCATLWEKVTALHAAVRGVPYAAVEMGNASDVPHTAEDVMRQNYGDCKDKATLLKALLRAASIDSAYVLVRTTDRGTLDRQLYGPAEFNHVILAVQTPEGDRFLDPTLPDAPADVLPPTVAGATGLIIRDAGTLVTLPTVPAAENRTATRVEITVHDDGSAGGQLTMTFTGQTAIMQRGMLMPVPKDRYREALEGTLAPRLGPEVAVTAVQVAHLQDAEQPLVITADFTTPSYLQTAGEQLSAYLPSFMYMANRFRSAKTRRFPLVQRLETSLALEVVITLPTGLTVTHLPDPVTYDGPLGRYADRAAVEGNRIHFTSEISTKRGEFPPDQLPDFRKWSSLLALEGRNFLQCFLRRP